MEALNIDYIGPFPEDEYGNTYVLTVIDTFSRAIGLYAVPSLEAIHTARMLIRHVGLFGCPSQIISDRGTHFTAEIIRELMILFGTDHVLTLAASKQENATVENANKRAQEFLRTMLFDHRIIPRWSDVCTTFGATDYDGRTKRGDWSVTSTIVVWQFDPIG
jgi:transposase InsO family protein